MCNINYTSLVFDETSQTITLEGTADCNSITASIVSPHFTNAKTAGVNVNGEWTIVYSGSDLLQTPQQIKQWCGKDPKINARCTEDNTCIGPAYFSPLLCAASELCPTINLRLINVSNNCQNGKRIATFEITINNPLTPSFYEIDFGDGNDAPIVYNGGLNPIQVSHEYSGGNFIAIVNSEFPVNCPSSNQINVPIPQCDNNCPDVVLELVSVSDCDPVTNKRTATFRIILSNVNNPPSAPCVYEFDFGDGESPNVLFDSTTVSPIIITHEYDNAGNYSAILNSTIPIGCPSSNSVLVTVTACDKKCPTDINFEIIDNNGNRFSVIDNNGTFEAVANNPFHQQVTCLPSGRYILRVTSPNDAGISFVWREDENPPQLESASRDFGFQLDANGNKSITVIVKKNGCTELAETVNLRTCRKKCCPNLRGLSASCMPKCPPSTTVTFTAQGEDLDCAEVYSWDFGDGTTAETNTPSITHTYSRFDQFSAQVAMVKPENCGGARVQRASVNVGVCPPSCLCAFLAIAFGFLLLALLSLMPMIACADPATKQVLLVILVVVALLLGIFGGWLLLDPCCRPTSCEMLRILFWVLSWALFVVGALAILQFCVSVIPFGLAYLIIQQLILNRINSQRCNPGAPDIFSWPFPACQ